MSSEIRTWGRVWTVGESGVRSCPVRAELKERTGQDLTPLLTWSCLPAFGETS